MKTVLLRSVSHELRTPLNTICFFINEMMEESSRLTYEESKRLKIVSISARLILSLIDDLLDYSKMLAGVFSIHKTHCDLKAIVKSTCELIQFQANKKNINLDIRIDPNIPEIVFTDALRFSQVLLNLMSNALKFTMKGYIEVSCVMTTYKRLKVFVEDTGIGISDSFKKRLFMEFTTDNMQCMNSSGSGLGLCISNILAKELGGKPIKLISKVGKGSIFYFCINTTDEDSVRSEYELCEHVDNENVCLNLIDYDRPAKSRDSEVLIVDDNDFNRIILGTLLTKYKIDFNEACNGKEALTQIIKLDSVSKPFKVIIMDCNMPELDGWETTKIIKRMFEEGKLSKMPNVIAHSAYTSDDDRKKCFESGMIDYIVKPSSPDKIMEIIKKYLNENHN